MRRDAEVVIAGGGPAGSTVANLLARAGHEVIVVDRATFPRFHVGESLLPTETRLYERLGFSPTEVDYVIKQGADFVDERIDDEVEYLFRDGLPGTPPHAWQADRAVFDHALLRHAAAAGATVCEGERVENVEVAAEAVDVRTDRRALRCSYFVDATGQDALLARRARSVEPIRGFGIASVLCHYDGLSEDVSAELEATGNVKILLRDEGWGWMIPLRGRRLSYGMVFREKGAAPALLDAATEASALTKRIIAGATRTEPSIVRNFAYLNTRTHGPRWACVGDAAAFLDPVFSSGVALAMHGAERLADVLAPALVEGRAADPELAAPVEAHMRHGYEVFGSLIHAFYKTRIVRHLFFHDDPDPDLRAGLITMLAGDVWRDENPFKDMLMAGRRRWRLPA